MLLVNKPKSRKTNVNMGQMCNFNTQQNRIYLLSNLTRFYFNFKNGHVIPTDTTPVTYPYCLFLRWKYEFERNLLFKND